MRRQIQVAALILALAGASMAHASDPADVAFWTSVSQSNDPGEFRAYLHAFPHGEFAAIAKIKLEELEGTEPANAPAPPQSDQAAATIAATRDTYRAIDRIELDVDASNLGQGSNHRLIIVPANAPDMVGDPNAFARASTPIAPEVLHMTLPPGPPGNDQIRLLYIPQFSTRFVVAARAPVRILPGAAGAVLATNLTSEATVLGAVRFEAKYRDRPIKIEGQFLRVEARTSGVDWNAVMHGVYQEPQNLAAIYIGALGTETDSAGPTEVLCLMPSGDHATLNRVAALHPGDDLVVTGTPTTWDSAFGTATVFFDRCQFAR